MFHHMRHNNSVTRSPDQTLILIARPPSAVVTNSWFLKDYRRMIVGASRSVFETFVLADIELLQSSLHQDGQG